MIRTCIPLSVLAGLLALLPLSVVKAESSSSGLPKALQECVDESDDTLRLACFDREMGKLSQAAASAPVAASAPAAVSEPVPASAPVADPVDTASSEEQFGIMFKGEKEELTEITATVVKVAVSANRIFTVKLDNDQIWRQKYIGIFHIKAGDVVTIEKGSFGGGYSLRLQGRMVAVNRLK